MTTPPARTRTLRPVGGHSTAERWTWFPGSRTSRPVPPCPRAPCPTARAAKGAPVLMLDLRMPRRGLADPATCPVCRFLRNVMRDVILSGSTSGARPVVLAMHTHMVHGHPYDPRTIRENAT
ncbi:hypothetical protein SEA_HEATHER_54 [Streptomyces phage Heather]|uniref:Uncharacterized protein n=1 Tax=Streptomyces phage Heather TaxID=2562343 RepID=A0A4D6E4J3_9CAUD|nr:hypothetical protein SEA_HEATHER_54 [Streptomyces phage Heather]